MRVKTEMICLADYVMVSQENKVSINGIFDNIKVRKFPGGITKVFFFAVVVGEPGARYMFTIKCEDIATGENILNDLKSPLVDISPNGKSNVIVEVVNLGFKKPGKYRFVIYKGKDYVGSSTLIVQAKKENKKKESN